MIFNKIKQELLKTAGLLKFSNYLKKNILDFIHESLNEFIYYRRSKYEYKKEFDMINDYPENYKLIVDGLKLIVELKVTDDDELFDNLAEFKTIQETKSGKNEIIFYINVLDEEVDFEELELTVEHELIHLTQNLLQLKTKSKINRFTNKEFQSFIESIIDKVSPEDKFVLELIKANPNGYKTHPVYYKYRNKFLISKGLRITDPEYLGTPKEFDYKKYLKKHEDKENYFAIPEEYFTLLNDSIKEYKLKKHSKEYFDDFTDGEVGSELSKEFWKSIQYNDKLYRRAIKELIDYIQKSL